MRLESKRRRALSYVDVAVGHEVVGVLKRMGMLARKFTLHTLELSLM